jgi:hypothetical protein
MNRRTFIKFSGLVAGYIAFGFNKNISGSQLIDDYEIVLLKRKLKELESLDYTNDISVLIKSVGESFIGTPYEAGTLDVNLTEKLIIKLSGLDCVTFVENSLALSRLVKKQKLTVEDYKEELKFIRYRGGKLDGYLSRLHYFTDWIYDNEQKGVVKDVTKEIGGKILNKNINFMSTHTDSYKVLKKNPDLVDELKLIEEEISGREIYYIPLSKVEDIYELLNDGDIIATVTSIDGLDVTHTGLVYKSAGETKFLHASLKNKEVIITSGELSSYLQGIKKCTGIIIARPQ